MANAGVKYLVSESWGSNPVPLDYLSWDPLADFVAIDSGVNAGRTTSANLGLVEPETPAVATPCSIVFPILSPLFLLLAGVDACDDYISSVSRASGVRPEVRSVLLRT